MEHEEYESEDDEDTQAYNYFHMISLHPNRIKMSDLDEVLDLRSYPWWDKSITIFGMRGSGKSYLALDLLIKADLLGRIGQITVITGTKDSNFWRGYVPDDSIFDVSDI